MPLRGYETAIAFHPGRAALSCGQPHQRQIALHPLAYGVVEVDVWNLNGAELACDQLGKYVREFRGQPLAPRPVESINADGIGLRFGRPAQVASPGATVPHRKP